MVAKNKVDRGLGMDFKSILKTVGSGLIANLVPGGSAIVSVINGFLPDDKKLPENATGEQANSAIDTLSPQDKAIVLSKQFDVEITEIREHTKVINALGEVDKTGNSTRPFIALLMAWVVAFAIVGLVIMLGVAINSKDHETVKAIGDNWPLFIALLGIPGALLRAYFGMRTKEKQQKYEAITGVSAPTGILSSILKR